MTRLGVGLFALRRSNRWNVLGRRLSDDAGNFGVGVRVAYVGKRRWDAADAHSGDRGAQHELHDLSPHCPLDRAWLTEPISVAAGMGLSGQQIIQ